MPLLARKDGARVDVVGMDPRKISFRHLHTADLALMHRWLNAPHVGRWYGEGVSYREVEEKYAPRIEGRDAVRPFVILHGDRPIGYIQSYPLSSDETYARLAGLENSAGIDLFIGEREYLHRGLGRSILRRFLAEKVFSEAGIEACVVGPEPQNVAAIRAYEKAGFRLFKTIRVPGESRPEYLMKLSRAEFEEAALG